MINVQYSYKTSKLCTIRSLRVRGNPLVQGSTVRQVARQAEAVSVPDWRPPFQYQAIHLDEPQRNTLGVRITEGLLTLPKGEGVLDEAPLVLLHNGFQVRLLRQSYDVFDRIWTETKAPTAVARACLIGICATGLRLICSKAELQRRTPPCNTRSSSQAAYIALGPVDNFRG